MFKWMFVCYWNVVGNNFQKKTFLLFNEWIWLKLNILTHESRHYEEFNGFNGVWKFNILFCIFMCKAFYGLEF